MGDVQCDDRCHDDCIAFISFNEIEIDIKRLSDRPCLIAFHILVLR